MPEAIEVLTQVFRTAPARQAPPHPLDKLELVLAMFRSRTMQAVCTESQPLWTMSTSRETKNQGVLSGKVSVYKGVVSHQQRMWPTNTRNRWLPWRPAMPQAMDLGHQQEKVSRRTLTVDALTWDSHPSLTRAQLVHPEPESHGTRDLSICHRVRHLPVTWAQWATTMSPPAWVTWAMAGVGWLLLSTCLISILCLLIWHNTRYNKWNNIFSNVQIEE